MNFKEYLFLITKKKKEQDIFCVYTELVSWEYHVNVNLLAEFRCVLEKKIIIKFLNAKIAFFTDKSIIQSISIDIKVIFSKYI